MTPDLFSTAWFRTHRRALCLLANLPGTRHALRNALLVEHGRPLVDLSPSSLTWRERDGKLTARFWSAATVAHALHAAYGRLWAAAHWFDMTVANRYAPALNLGCDSFTARPNGHPETTTCDGWLEALENPYSGIWDWSWSSARGQDGTDYNDYYGEGYHSLAESDFDSGSGWGRLRRAQYGFDCSTLSGVTCTAGSLTLSVISTSYTCSTAPTFALYNTSSTATTELAASDFQKAGTTAYSSSYSIGSVGAMTLNSAGLTYLASAGSGARFCLRSANFDAGGTEPSGGAFPGWNLYAYFAEDTTLDHRPRLQVTYTPASSGGSAQVIVMS